MSATERFLADFTKREDELLAKVAEYNLTLPFRLYYWRQWIGDSVIYLNELAGFVLDNTPKAELVSDYEI